MSIDPGAAARRLVERDVADLKPISGIPAGEPDPAAVRSMTAGR